MSWTEHDGVREIGSEKWHVWSSWSDDLLLAMIELKLGSPHWLLDEPTRFLPQECEICRHCTEVKEAMIGQKWEEDLQLI